MKGYSYRAERKIPERDLKQLLIALNVNWHKGSCYSSLQKKKLLPNP